MDKLTKFLRDNKDFFLNFPRKNYYTANEITDFRKKYPYAPISKILSQILLQKKMIGRVENSYQMFFTPKATQQATIWQVAKYHAKKLQKYDEIADLCCGIGADLKYLVKGKKVVYALDSDEVTLDYAIVNFQINPDVNIVFLNERAENFDKKIQAIYIDPDRRYKGKRELNPNNYSPSLKQIYSLFKITKNIMIKLSPATDYRKLSPPIDYSLEFISCCGELKEILLCFGELADNHLKKTVIVDKDAILSSSCDAEYEDKDLLNYIIEPDPSIIKSRMTSVLAQKLDSNILRNVPSLITANNGVRTNFAKTYKVIFKDKLKNLNNYLKKNEIGHLVLKTRGFPIEVERYRKRFKLKGRKKAIILIIPEKRKFIFLELELI